MNISPNLLLEFQKRTGRPGRKVILAQQEEIQALRQENDKLCNQLTALATELASLRERIGRSSRNSSKPPSSDGPGFKPPERRKASRRKRGVKPGHPGAGPEPLPPLRHVAGWRGSRPIAPSGDRDSANHAGGDQTPAAPAGVILLFHQHLRHSAGVRSRWRERLRGEAINSIVCLIMRHHNRPLASKA